MSGQQKNIQTRGVSIKGKIFIGFSIVLGFFILTMMVMFYNLHQNKLYSEKIINIYIPIERQSIDLSSYVIEMRRAYTGWLLSRDKTYKDLLEDSMAKIRRIENKIDDLRGDSFTNAENSVWMNIKNSIEKYYNLKSDVEKFLSQPAITADDIKKFWHEQIESQSVMVSKMINAGSDHQVENGAGFINIQSALLVAGIGDLIENNQEIELYVSIMFMITIFASILAVYITSKKITLPLNEAIDAAKRIADGQRSVQFSARERDETGLLINSLESMQTAIRKSEDTLRIKEKETKDLLNNIVNTAKRFSSHSSNVASGDLRNRIQLHNEDNEMMSKLGADLNAMTDGLSIMTKQIMETSHNMVSTLEEVRRAVEVQSSGATEQAASINEITASLAEIEKSTAQTIDKARALGKAAKRTQEKGHLGLNSVEESVNGMRLVREKVQLIAQTILDLSKQTQQIGAITAVVTNLAQQSKMLALNASIEAAKAGEAGKGFAVVAAEVKNLAEQSELSTSQVQQILEEIRHGAEKAVMVTEEGTKGVDHGMQLVEQAGDIMRNLNEVIHDATVASQQIEAAITQEGVGIEQITAGMNEINQVTSSLVSSVKQTTEAISNLAEISKKLKTTVDIYKV